MAEITVSPEHAIGFRVGDPITFAGKPRWYVRLWRWFTRYKPVTLVITAVDYENGSITVEQAD